MDRGVRLDRTYQLNFGGNTDFLNMLERERLESKKICKTNAVTSMLDYEMDPDDVHVGPSDHVPWLLDRKWCYIRMEGTTYGDVPLNAELKLEVWDSPNSAGVITDAIRCLKLGLDRGLKGTLVAPSSYFMKSPPQPDPRRHRVQPRRGVHPRRGQRDARWAPRRRSRRRSSGWPAPRPRWPPPRGDRRRRRLEAPHRRRRLEPEDRGAVGRPRLPRRLLAAAHPAARSDRGRARARVAGVVPALADQAGLVEPELRARPRAAAGPPAGPPGRAARVPRIRPLPRRADARPVHAARTRSSRSWSRSTRRRSSASATRRPRAGSS